MNNFDKIKKPLQQVTSEPWIFKKFKNPQRMPEELKKEGPKFELTEDQINEIKSEFDKFDFLERGVIDIKNMKSALLALGIVPKRTEFDTFERHNDKKRTGKINFEAFLRFVTKKMSEKAQKDYISKAFELFCDEKTKTISLQMLKRISKELGEKYTNEELQLMIKEADLDGDGVVNLSEFLRIMKKTSIFDLF